MFSVGIRATDSNGGYLYALLQSCRVYLREALVFVGNSARWKGFSFSFWRRGREGGVQGGLGATL